MTQYGVTLSRQEIQARLDARTIKGPNCWAIQGAAVHGGYVHFGLTINGRQRLFKAHRVAWELANGPIPEDMRVMHACDNPRCVNPSHLSLGTQTDNIRDSIRKGRYNTFGIQKLNAEKVHQIRALWKSGAKQKDIARQFGIARNTVSGIVNGRFWCHLHDESAQPVAPSTEQALGALYGANSAFELVPSVHVPIRGEVR